MSPYLRGRLDEESVKWLKDREENRKEQETRVYRKQTLLGGMVCLLTDSAVGTIDLLC